ncbi:uncharacterized protein LOC109604850 isoform X2 [Aethina tumida]|uniref:uncharacterized protein LOC109604850 isoform X2 n=1 Tax=Aethina tumida TaxID=116153 RepID=UPI002147852D|nr:uncharacterized protein LOC109604850 isoform X2 [Aethina tumida]
MSKKKESDLPDLKFLRREFKKYQHSCLICNSRTPPLCFRLNNENISELQLKMQVGKLPVYCWTCACNKIKLPIVISLESDSETEKENRVSDNETADNGYIEKTSAIPTTIQGGPSTAAIPTELHVSAPNVNESLQSEFLEVDAHSTPFSVRKYKKKNTRVATRRSGRVSKKTPPALL